MAIKTKKIIPQSDIVKEDGTDFKTLIDKIELLTGKFTEEQKKNIEEMIKDELKILVKKEFNEGVVPSLHQIISDEVCKQIKMIKITL